NSARGRAELAQHACRFQTALAFSHPRLGLSIHRALLEASDPSGSPPGLTLISPVRPPRQCSASWQSSRSRFVASLEVEGEGPKPRLPLVAQYLGELLSLRLQVL